VRAERRNYKEMAPGAKENLEQRSAFDHWIGQGKGRTLLATRKHFQLSSATIKKWHYTFKWDERMREMEEGGQEVTLYQKPDPVVMDSQEVQDLRELISRLKVMIDRAFYVDKKGNSIPKFDIVDVEDFTKVMKQYKECVEAYMRMTSPVSKGKRDGDGDKNKIADTINLIMGNLTQEERIGLLSGGANKNITVDRGNGTPESTVEIADYTEVPERGVQKRRGRKGVLGGVAGTESGDEGELRKPRARISLPCAVGRTTG